MTRLGRKKIVVYTPTYSRSLGIRYRVDMMVKALEPAYDVKVIGDSGTKEDLIRALYGSIGSRLVGKRFVWELLGERISRAVLAERPDAAILVTDMTAGAIPRLKKNGIASVLSVEDLTPEWLGGKASRGYFDRLACYSNAADGVISVSERLSDKLLGAGISSAVVPPGLERILCEKEAAVIRSSSLSLINSGRLYFDEEYAALAAVCKSLGNRYSVWAYSGGKIPSQFKSVLSEVKWYCYARVSDALSEASKHPIGMIIRFRAHRPTRIFFHASLLQPILAIGNQWAAEVLREGIGVKVDPGNAREGLEEIFRNYEFYVSNIFDYAKRNLIENAYAPLMGILRKALGEDPKGDLD